MNYFFKAIEINLFVFFMLFSAVFIGQDSLVKNSFIVESQVYPNWNADNYKPAIKLRLVISENHVLRSNFALNNSKTYREIFSSTGPNDGVGSVENISQFFSFSLGYEHLTKYDRITLYNGLEGILGFGSDAVYGSRTDSISFIADQNFSSIVPLQHFGFKVFSGIDFNITPNLYIGTEIGLVLLKEQRKTGAYQKLDESSTTSPVVNTSIASSSSINLVFSGMGCIRVGWRFIKK